MFCLLAVFGQTDRRTAISQWYFRGRERK